MFFRVNKICNSRGRTKEIRQEGETKCEGNLIILFLVAAGNVSDVQHGGEDN